ncbi:dentin sialophosphoprotein-like [Centruroides sculpturatus]|uniref:dentin sialophosphoprotein-like n=1 Tax=Centruroides sculpturatus TaxID=218467 RepID=UPI000C6EB5B7|nr:dentin sialophosphoprotein-like [Centruroides sculpturatus]
MDTASSTIILSILLLYSVTLLGAYGISKGSRINLCDEKMIDSFTTTFDSCLRRDIQNIQENENYEPLSGLAEEFETCFHASYQLQCQFRQWLLYKNAMKSFISSMKDKSWRVYNSFTLVGKFEIYNCFLSINFSKIELCLPSLYGYISQNTIKNAKLSNYYRFADLCITKIFESCPANLKNTFKELLMSVGEIQEIKTGMTTTIIPENTDFTNELSQGYQTSTSNYYTSTTHKFLRSKFQPYVTVPINTNLALNIPANIPSKFAFSPYITVDPILSRQISTSPNEPSENGVFPHVNSTDIFHTNAKAIRSTSEIEPVKVSEQVFNPYITLQSITQIPSYRGAFKPYLDNSKSATEATSKSSATETITTDQITYSSSVLVPNSSNTSGNDNSESSTVSTASTSDINITTNLFNQSTQTDENKTEHPTFVTVNRTDMNTTNSQLSITITESHSVTTETTLTHQPSQGNVTMQDKSSTKSQTNSHNETQVTNSTNVTTEISEKNNKGKTEIGPPDQNGTVPHIKIVTKESTTEKQITVSLTPETHNSTESKQVENTTIEVISGNSSVVLTHSELNNSTESTQTTNAKTENPSTAVHHSELNNSTESTQTTNAKTENPSDTVHHSELNNSTESTQTTNAKTENPSATVNHSELNNSTESGQVTKTTIEVSSGNASVVVTPSESNNSTESGHNVNTGIKIDTGTSNIVVTHPTQMSFTESVTNSEIKTELGNLSTTVSHYESNSSTESGEAAKTEIKANSGNENIVVTHPAPKNATESA